MAELPLACSLNGAELPRRLADMSVIGHTDLLAADVDGRHAVLSFKPAARERLSAIVAAEAECCPFLDMKIDARPDAIQLAIEAPAGAESTLAELVAAFSGGRAPA